MLNFRRFYLKITVRRSAWQRKRFTVGIYPLVPDPHDALGTTHAWAEASEFADAPAVNAAFATPVKYAKKKIFRGANGRCAERYHRSAVITAPVAAQNCLHGTVRSLLLG
jgi:hypothetical protein